jgi:hypothetical protein
VYRDYCTFAATAAAAAITTTTTTTTTTTRYTIQKRFELQGRSLESLISKQAEITLRERSGYLPSQDNVVRNNKFIFKEIYIVITEFYYEFRISTLYDILLSEIIQGTELCAG